MAAETKKTDGARTEALELWTRSAPFAFGPGEWTLSLDVESMPLHGTGFGVGACLFSPERKEVASFLAYADYKSTPEHKLYLDDLDGVGKPGYVAKLDGSTRAGIEYVLKNVVPAIPAEYRSETPGTRMSASLAEMRQAFWACYRAAADGVSAAKGATLVVAAECGFPVEANFFRACILDDLAKRAYQGPFPLHEIATRVLAKCPDDKSPQYAHLNRREPAELPAHNPLCDARQSARIWFESL